LLPLMQIVFDLSEGVEGISPLLTSAMPPLPDGVGQITCDRKILSSPSRKNIYLAFFRKSEVWFTPSRAHLRGVSRSSRTWSAGCGGRAGSLDEGRWRVRRNRVVLASRR
jgi:hypothetical protein